MTWTPQISTVNQTLQLGAESTPGTGVAASKLINCFMFQFGPKGNFKQTTGTGRKYPSVQQLNSEWTEGSYSGSMDYNGIIYPVAGALGIANPAAHGTSSVAKDWKYDAILSGSRQPQTYTIEQGEAATRAHKFAYGLITQFDYKFSRQDSSISGNVLAQSVQDGITMTASPTSVVLAPISGEDFNLYIDSSSANLGNTQILGNISGEVSVGGIYGPAWFVNRSNSSFGSHVDLKPATSVKFMVAADASGMAYLADMRSGDTIYMRVEAQGQIIDNSYKVDLGSPSAGTFDLTYGGQTASGIAFNATSSTIQSDLEALSSVGTGNVTVSGSGPFTVTFTGTLATSSNALTGNGSSLTGGTFLITSEVVHNLLQHDMAVKIGQPGQWSDSNGIYAIEWDGMIFEDGTWGHSHILTATNLLTAI